MKKNKDHLNIGKTLKAARAGERFSLSEQQIASLKRTAEVALAVVAMAGIATIAIAAPNVLQAVDKLFLKKHRRRLSAKELRQKTSQAFYYLKRSRLIQLKRDGNDWKVFLTSLGQNKIQKIQSDIRRIPRPKKWNEKWWLTAADIPTKNYRQGADLLRRKLKELGFFPLQRTLWLFPYDPRAEMQFLADHYNITQFVTVMEINRLDKDDEEKAKAYLQAKNLL